MNFSIVVIISLLLGLFINKLYFSSKAKIIAEKTTLILVLILIFLIGTFLGNTFSNISNLYLIPLSFAISAAILITTIFIGYVLNHGFVAKKAYKRTYNYKMSIFILISLTFGILEHFTLNIKGLSIDIVLYLLLFVVGYQINFDLRNLKNYFREISLCLAAALSGALIIVPIALLFNMNIKALLLCSFGLGWYTFSGSFLTVVYGSLYGSLGFLVNLFREQMTILLSPFISKFGNISLVSSAGATAMDTSLPFIKMLSDDSVIVPAFMSGVILTIMVPIYSIIYEK
jgi:uncharacterized membrane protein YbjE (DUF340 family)